MTDMRTFDGFGYDLGRGIHNFDGDDLAVLLTVEEPTLEAVRGRDVQEVDGRGNGYDVGGKALTETAFVQDGRVGRLTAAELTFVGYGAGYGPFRYAVLYSRSSDRLIGWWDLEGRDVFLHSGSSYTLAWSERGVLEVSGG